MKNPNRTEYIEWAKERALAYLECDRPDDAPLSLLSDFNKERELVGRATIEYAKTFAFLQDPRQFIEGFQ